MLKKVDYKIIFELDNNARQSYGKIAKNIKTSKQVVGYHLNSLIKEGIIKKFLTIFDLSKLGLILHKVYFRLVNVSEQKEKEILEFLKIHKNVAWLVRTEGIYDLAFALHTKDIIELNKVLLEIENKYGDFISEKVVNRVITGEFFHRDYLTNEKISSFRKEIVFQTQEEKRKLDEIDWKIIAALSRDSRANVINISKNTPISADAIGKRIKNLEKSGTTRR